MRTARIAIVVIGVLLPFASRLLGGIEWITPYVDHGLFEILLTSTLNAIVWGSLLVISFFYEHPRSLLLPCACGFGYVGWAHYTLDLTADAQAGVAVAVIPFYALALIVPTGALGYLLDRYWRGDSDD